MSNSPIPIPKIYIGELISSTGEVVVKIGFTMYDPLKRLALYAAIHGYTFSKETAKVAVFKVTPATMRGVEFVLHNTFKAARVGTLEIFRISFDVAVSAAKLATGRNPE